MGRGYDFKCKKCRKEYSAIPGIKMLYLSIYQEAVEHVKNGKYGIERQQLMNTEEYVAVNAERQIYICSECKHWKTDLDLLLYRPKDIYSLIKVFVHKCEKCKKQMNKAKDVKIENFPCSKCGIENSSNGLLM